MKRKLLITGIVIGVILVLGPLWGAIGTTIAIKRINELSGIADPKPLDASIDLALNATTFGLYAFPVGAALCVYCIIKLSRQPPALPKQAAQESPDLKA